MSTTTAATPALKELLAAVYAHGKCLAEQSVPLPLVIGRQNPETGEPVPFHVVPATAAGEPAKFIVEKFQRQSSLSRSHVQILPLGNNGVRLTNVGKNAVAVTSAGQVLQSGQQLDATLPVDIAVGELALTFKAPHATNEHYSSLGFQTIGPAHQPRLLQKGKLAALLQTVDRRLCDELMECLRDVLVVLQQAGSELGFFEQAADALRGVIGLQNAAVMLYKDGKWIPQAIVTEKDDEWRPSRGALAQLLASKSTLRSKGAAETESIQSVSHLVAAPILDAEGNVLGALYGDRRERDRTSGQVEVSEVEAMLADMLASAVATGIARLAQEKKEVANRVLLEQFFTPVLARQLESNDQLMRCKETDVTCLFCDVRGFSGVSERSGPAITLDWLSDVMERLGQCVLDTGGVLVDQIGDEFLAMWGAPEQCTDHAARAIQALHEMLRVAPEISRDWQLRIGGETHVGYGLNSGLAVVGNTGSKLRFRYAPLGDTVNLASRLQGSTKYFKVNSILSHATAQSCPPNARRRLGRIRVVNRDRDTSVYEYTRQVDAQWTETKKRYEEALDIFEAGDFRGAIQRLGALLAVNPDDGPTLLLLSRSYAAMTQGPDSHHPVWTLPGK